MINIEPFVLKFAVWKGRKEGKISNLYENRKKTEGVATIMLMSLLLCL